MKKIMKVRYNPKLKDLARQLRNKSTKSEIKLWRYLKGKQMMGYDFHRQKPIENFIAGFFCNKLKFVIELDGHAHGFEDIVKRDELKEERLKELGIHVLRFRDDDVMNDIDNVLRAIQHFIEELERKEEHTPQSPLSRGDTNKKK